MAGKRGADPGADVRGGVQLERNGALFQILEQVKVPNRREGVTDALGTDGQRLADGLRASGFAGVVGQP